MDQVAWAFILMGGGFAAIGFYEKWRLDRQDKRIEAEIARRRSWEERQAR